MTDRPESDASMELEIPDLKRQPDCVVSADSPSEASPTLEGIIDLIRKLTAKRDDLNETIDGLKKQVSSMVKKL